MNYDEALNCIFSLPAFSYPLGNESLSALLKKLGSPQKGMKFIHIAGTNGKGSAAAMLGSILSCGGYKTGIFTSPFIQHFNERITIGGEQIPDERLAALVERTLSCGIPVSQFAFILACALLYYSEEKCDFVILEAGLGGRLDATNVIEESLLSVIMSIGLDHTEYLGDTVEKIAAEKCGIIKPGGRVAAYRNNSGADAVIEEFCKRQGAELAFSSEAYKTETGFVCGGKEYLLPLKGEYQAANASCVLTAVDMLRKAGVELSDAAVRCGFGKCSWSARFEYIRPDIIVDGAHNPDGIAALCRSVEKIKGHKIALIAMMKDKAVEECAEKLSGYFDGFIVTQLDMPRCMSAESLGRILMQYNGNVRTVSDLNEAFGIADASDGTIVVCGSLFLAGRALDYFGGGI